MAACRDGCATMDVGARTDVMDMCPKHIAISRMVRSMRPDVVAVDELGDARDVQAVLEARRSGVAILATAHARGISDALGRPALGDMLRLGAFDLVAVLAGDIGEVSEIRNWRGEEAI